MPNTKSPLAVSTWPPPSLAMYTPRSVERTISSGSLSPSVTNVFVMRTIGRCM